MSSENGRLHSFTYNFEITRCFVVKWLLNRPIHHRNICRDSQWLSSRSLFSSWKISLCDVGKSNGFTDTRVMHTENGITSGITIRASRTIYHRDSNWMHQMRCIRPLDAISLEIVGRLIQTGGKTNEQSSTHRRYTIYDIRIWFRLWSIERIHSKSSALELD